ncbi:hypothetical protein [Streptomyces sp. NPDC054834]
MRVLSPQAKEVFGDTAEEALGRYVPRLLVNEEHREMVIFEVMGTVVSGAGAFPIRHKDGSTRLVGPRNMRGSGSLPGGGVSAGAA